MTVRVRTSGRDEEREPTRREYGMLNLREGYGPRERNSIFSSGFITDRENVIMSCQEQVQAHPLCLKGSVDLVVEFFSYCISNILYQRGVHPDENFKHTTKYNLPLVVASDPSLREYLRVVLEQVNEWLMKHEVQRITVAITGKQSLKVLERWTFEIDADKSTDENSKLPTDLQLIQRQIQGLIRQITASVTFLPLLNEAVTWDLLVYTESDTEVPDTWETSDPMFVLNAQTVRLRSFDTQFHKVSGSVAYELPDVSLT